MRTVLGGVVRVLSSFGLSCTLLILLALLTFLGTLEQVNSGLFEVQKKYFESFVLIHDSGLVPIPLPGANLVMTLLFVNVIVGGLVRLRKRWRKKLGIMVVHVGIAFLLFSGFVKLYHSEDGALRLHEGESANYFQSYYRWEIALTRDLGDGRSQEFLIPQEDFMHARGARPVTFVASELPFDLEVGHFMVHCRPRLKGPMFDVPVPVVDGCFLELLTPLATAEQNRAGLYVTAVGRDGTRHPGILWGVDAAPLTVSVGGTDWAVDLRHERYPMPFTVELNKFTKEDHPRTNMPSEFSSAVTVTEAGASRPVEISMNEPLRDRGLVLFQANWGPQGGRPGAPFSVFSVVRNPADQYPLIACIVIGIGLLLHFLPVLHKYVRSEARQTS